MVSRINPVETGFIQREYICTKCGYCPKKESYQHQKCGYNHVIGNFAKNQERRLSCKI